MKKTPCLFLRDFAGDPSRVLPVINPEAQWVIDGEGCATVKVDGSACLWKDGRLWGRYDAKPGRTPPSSFAPAQDAPDPHTQHFPGWVWIEQTGFHKIAAEALELAAPVEGVTYELVGPKVNGNPHRLDRHALWQHGSRFIYTDVASHPAPEAAYHYLAWYLSTMPEEGIVWWREWGKPDCDKVKLRRKDFGLEWPIRGM